jgi:hypothetical protein
MHLRSGLLPALFAVSFSGMASAATFQIDFSVSGTMSIFGSFEAPITGGLVTGFEVTLSGVTFDTQVSGGAFEYDPVTNDFINYTGFPAFTNSVATALCGAGACGLELYPTNDGSPGDYLAVDALLANIDDGTKYLIVPPAIPLPATALLLLGALACIGAARLRRA